MNELNKILSSIFKVKESELADDLTMEDVAIWDSLKHMELIATIEEELAIELSADDIINMISIKTIRSTVAEKI